MINGPSQELPAIRGGVVLVSWIFIKMELNDLKQILALCLSDNTEYKEKIEELRQILLDYNLSKNGHCLYLDTFQVSIPVTFTFVIQSHDTDSETKSVQCSVNKYDVTFTRQLDLIVSPKYMDDCGGINQLNLGMLIITDILVL